MVSPHQHPPCTNNLAISVNALSKSYTLYEAPSDRLKQLAVNGIHRLTGISVPKYGREFWALRDISFTIGRGETVGLIGRNGAGKSTLLQIICGTLNSTAGSVATVGRIAALLELGAGFNPEFTGRENVYMNGAILGLSRKEMEDRFDNIAAFADIGDFLDQPVKNYSSGMYIRLAFAVQTAVEPDILIVDEALAVGDIGFQYKCFRRIEALRTSGVTILMVSHSTSSILEYADRCIVLEGGRVIQDTSDVLKAVLAYEKGMVPEPEPVYVPELRQWPVVPDIETLRTMQLRERNAELGEKRFGSSRALISKVALTRAGNNTGTTLIRANEDVVFRFHLYAVEAIPNVVLGVSLSKTQGGDIWGDNNLFAGKPMGLSAGETVIEYSVRLPISAGEYLLHCGLTCIDGPEREELDQRRPIAKLVVWSPRQQVSVVFAPIDVRVVPHA